jgi:hypothetical protein
MINRTTFQYQILSELRDAAKDWFYNQHAALQVRFRHYSCLAGTVVNNSGLEVRLQFDRPYLRNLTRTRSRFSIGNDAVLYFRSNSEGTKPLAAQLYLAPPGADPLHFLLLNLVDRIRRVNTQIDRRLVYRPRWGSPNPWQNYDDCV